MKGLKDRIAARREEKAGLRKKALPLLAFYGREPDVERRRGSFYAAMATVYGWSEWKLEPIHDVNLNLPDVRGGRDGRPPELRGVGKKHVMPVILNAAPFEYLFSKGKLQGERDAQGASYRRLSAGQRLRGIFEGAEISGLKAANLEGTSGGGMPGRLPGEYKMDCIRYLSQLRGPEWAGGMPAALFSLLEAVVYRDRWLWEELRADRQEAFFLRLHKALDLLSVRLRMMSAQDFTARWRHEPQRAEGPGSPDPSPDRRSGD